MKTVNEIGVKRNRVKRKWGMQRTQYHAVSDFNSLSQTIKDSRNVNSFKPYFLWKSFLNKDDDYCFILVCNFFTSKHYRSRCRSRRENLDRSQYPLQPIKIRQFGSSQSLWDGPFNIRISCTDHYRKYIFLCVAKLLRDLSPNFLNLMKQITV